MEDLKKSTQSNNRVMPCAIDDPAQNIPKLSDTVAYYKPSIF